MHAIIALWTHPRSISTAFERIMMERGDVEVLHEPFSYLYYVHQKKATITQQYVDPDHPTDYAGIKSSIEQAAGRLPVFFKDMGAHCFSDLMADDAFLQRLTNTFLVRDPAKAIASYYAMNPNVTVDEIGLRQLYGIYQKVCALGRGTVVIDADDLQSAPEETVAAYCRRIGWRHIASALTWTAGFKDEWKIWRDWHANAARSTGIRPTRRTYAATVENNAHLKALYDDQLPYYRAMRDRRIVPPSQG